MSKLWDFQIRPFSCYIWWPLGLCNSSLLETTINTYSPFSSSLLFLSPPFILLAISFFHPFLLQPAKAVCSSVNSVQISHLRHVRRRSGDFLGLQQHQKRWRKESENRFAALAPPQKLGFIAMSMLFDLKSIGITSLSLFNGGMVFSINSIRSEFFGFNLVIFYIAANKMIMKWWGKLVEANIARFLRVFIVLIMKNV